MNRIDSNNTVHVVHCIDAEGPLHESLQATFERLRQAFGVCLAPSLENLEKLRARELDLGGWEAAVARMVSREQLEYLDTWDKLDSVLDEVFSTTFRGRYVDSFGNGWVCNWFCLDHVGFEGNPRRRAFGYHGIFDAYLQRLDGATSLHDTIGFHYHPVPFSRQANHRCANLFFNSDTLFQVLARRVVDHNWFPCANRPGFNVTRPDSHWFMEQYIPFDFANQAVEAPDRSQPDRTTGRFVDWRRAPVDWRPYHPAHDDYQRPGDCRRWIARCLNIGSRARCLYQEEVDRAFAQAAKGEPVILAFADHDHRDIRPDIAAVHGMLLDATRRFPGTRFRHCTAREAFRRAMQLDTGDAFTFNLQLQGTVLHIETDKPLFGPQPFLALKTKGGRYFTDNLDCDAPFRRWSYTFDEESIPLAALEAVGVAGCSPSGNVGVSLLDPERNVQDMKQL